mmetsp:Transcript_23941/g.33486  ORF Transcript_23941/g.33486 Transcript_23941/m.33486 type:complete len:241 (+) Transcript_23941:87-809(+)
MKFVTIADSANNGRPGGMRIPTLSITALLGLVVSSLCLVESSPTAAQEEIGRDLNNLIATDELDQIGKRSDNSTTTELRSPEGDASPVCAMMIGFGLVTGKQLFSKISFTEKRGWRGSIQHKQNRMKLDLREILTHLVCIIVYSVASLKFYSWIYQDDQITDDKVDRKHKNKTENLHAHEHATVDFVVFKLNLSFSGVLSKGIIEQIIKMLKNIFNAPHKIHGTTDNGKPSFNKKVRVIY